MLKGVGRLAGALMAATLVLALSACLLAPGRFSSDLEIRKSGEFSFSYTGELVFLPMTEKKKEPRTFEPLTCYGNDEVPAPGDDPYGVRECTAKELAEQKAQWEEMEATRTESERKEAESARAFFGGLDPEDPKSGEELAQRLRRQAGWKKVVYRGKGIFDVEYAISGRLDHDFVFPTIERFAMSNAFVHISRRNDGTVRVDAPGFGPPVNPMTGMAGMFPASGTASDKPAGGSDQPAIDGRFSLRTDAAILANNTDEGPQTDPVGQRLDWRITSLASAAPTALLRLSQ